MVMFNLANSPQVLGTRKGYVLSMTYVWYSGSIHVS